MRELEITYTEDFKESFGDDFEILEKLVDEVLEKSHRLDKIDRPLNIEFDVSEKDFVTEKMHGVHGLTRNPERIEFNLSSRPDDWKTFFKSQLAHEYAHTVFMSYEDLEYESNIENWKHILLEAHGQLFAQKVFSDVRPEWRTKFSRTEIRKEWAEIRKKLDIKIFTESIFNSEDYHPWFGYSLSFYIGKELIEKNDLKDFPLLKKEDVIEAGDQIFEKD